MMDKSIKWEYKKIYFYFVSLFAAILFLLSCSIVAYRIWNHFRTSSEAYNAVDRYPFEDGEMKILYDSSKKETPLIYIQNRIENILTTASVSFCFDMPSMHYQFLKHCGMNVVTAQFSSGIDAKDTAIEVMDHFYINTVEADPALVDQYADSLAKFGTQMKEQDRDFVYFSFPHKEFGVSDPVREKYYPNDIRQIEETVMTSLRNAELDTVSCMDLIEEQGIRLEDIFFKTDHHWTPQSGIWACGELAKYLNETCGFSIDRSLFSQDCYHVETMKDAWMGSQGVRATPAYAEPEDYYIVTPNYQTDYDVFISKENDTLSGCMKDVLFDWESLKTNKTASNVPDMYMCYGYGDQPLVQIHNNLVSDGSRVLMIKASMADVMFPYFAAAVENLDVIDLRYFDGSLQTYIKETDPDTVIVMYSSACFSESDSSNQYLFDFR